MCRKVIKPHLLEQKEAAQDEMGRIIKLIEEFGKLHPGAVALVHDEVQIHTTDPELLRELEQQWKTKILKG